MKIMYEKNMLSKLLPICLNCGWLGQYRRERRDKWIVIDERIVCLDCYTREMEKTICKSTSMLD
jgi:hypothetical protein